MVASSCSALPQNLYALENLPLARYTSFRLESGANNPVEIILQKKSASSFELKRLLPGNGKCGFVVVSSP